MRYRSYLEKSSPPILFFLFQSCDEFSPLCIDIRVPIQKNPFVKVNHPVPLGSMIQCYLKNRLIEWTSGIVDATTDPVKMFGDATCIL